MTIPRLAWISCGTAVLLASLVYVNALDNPFVYDDVRLIVQNRSLDPPLSWRAILLQNVSRPLVNVSYVADRAIWGREPFGFHLTSVLLHMLNVALLFVFTRGVVIDRMREAWVADDDRRAVIAGFAAAALFAVHPMMTEAVGYISGRSDLLSGTFMLLALVAIRQWMNTDRMSWLVLALVGVLCALGSKETAVVLPLLLLYYVWFVRRDDRASRRRHLLALLVPLLAIAILGTAVRLGLFVFIEYAGRVGWQWRFALAELDVFTRYLALMIVPAGQTIFHAIPATTSLTDPRALMAMGTAAISLVIVVAATRRRSVAGFGLTWFVLMLLPSALLVLLDRGEPMAERRVYFASAGLFLACGHAAGAIASSPLLGRPFTRRLSAAAGVALILSLAGRTIVRNTVWASPITLWAEAAQRSPNHWLPWLVLGESLHQAGRHAEAVPMYRKALVTGSAVSAVHENLGLCLVELRRFDEARAAYRALSGIDPKSAAAANGVALAALVEGDLQEARNGFLAALDLDPRNIEARRGLVAVEESRGGRSDEAFRRCEEIELLAHGTPGARECLERHRPPPQTR